MSFNTNTLKNRTGNRVFGHIYTLTAVSTHFNNSRRRRRRDPPGTVYSYAYISEYDYNGRDKAPTAYGLYLAQRVYI